MGCDIHIFTEVRNSEGRWVENDKKIFPDWDGKLYSSPFDYRHYSMFSFLAGVRNDSKIAPISEPRGLPNDSEWLNAVSKYAYTKNPMNGEDIPISEQDTNRRDIEQDFNYHSLSHLYLKELLDFDYESTLEDRKESSVFKSKDGNTVMMGSIFNSTVPKGDGVIKTYREFLGDNFFKELERMKQLGEPGNVRIVFWFDN